MAIKARRFTRHKKPRKEHTREEVIAKWSGAEGIKRVFPNGQKSLGSDAERLLRYLCRYPVCEVGCGTGRVAGIFHHRQYIGIDINDDALAHARAALKRFDFRLIEWDDPFPEAETYLFYTVLLHIPDDEIESMIAKTKRRVVVAEPMNRWIREYGMSSNFQRDPGEYREMFEDHGMVEKELYHVHLPYFPYYINMVLYENDK